MHVEPEKLNSLFLVATDAGSEPPPLASRLRVPTRLPTVAASGQPELPPNSAETLGRRGRGLTNSRSCPREQRRAGTQQPLQMHNRVTEGPADLARLPGWREDVSGLAIVLHVFSRKAEAKLKSLGLTTSTQRDVDVPCGTLARTRSRPNRIRCRFDFLCRGRHHFLAQHHQRPCGST